MPDDNLWRQLFSDQSLIQAFMGGLGGSMRALRLRTSFREGLRVIAIGAGTAFGVGVFAPTILRPYFGDLPAGVGSAFAIVSAGSFLIGLVAVTIIEKAIDEKKVDERVNEAQKGASSEGEPATGDQREKPKEIGK